MDSRRRSFLSALGRTTDPYSMQLPHSTETAPVPTGYPQSSQRYVLDEPRPEDYASSPERTYQQAEDAFCLATNAYSSYVGSSFAQQPSYRENEVGSGALFQHSHMRNDMSTGYPYTHSGSSLQNSSYSPYDAFASSDQVLLPSAQRISIGGSFQSETGYVEQDNSRFPSILINNRSSIDVPPRDDCQRPDQQEQNSSEYRALWGIKGGAQRPQEVNLAEDSHSFPSFDASATDPTDAGQKKKKKVKMHQCEICSKQFPRPSGLKTHMNTHNNLKPFPCKFPGCNRTFTVRSNAKRHLRTHGIDPDDAVAETMIPRSPSVGFEVNFNEPVVQEQENSLSTVIPQLKWMPPSLSSRTNASLRSVPGDRDSDSDWEDLKDDPVVEGYSSIPLHSAVPTDARRRDEDSYEERDRVSPSHSSHASQSKSFVRV